MKILLVYNKALKSKKAKNKHKQVCSLLEKHSVDAHIVLSEYKQHAMEIVSNANFSEYKAIVGAGGDGTLFEILNGVFKNKSDKKIPIGIIPIGTGNSFIRDLGENMTDMETAIVAIKSFKTKAIDIGKFISQNKAYYFINILNMGFASDVSATGQKHRYLGDHAYTLGVLYHTLKLKPIPTKVILDEKPYHFDSVLISVSNSRYTGGAYLMAPNANLQDGLLDVTIAKKMGGIRLLQLFKLIFNGTHIHEPEVETFQARHIKIETEKNKIISPDGELIGSTPIEIECLPKAIEVIYKA